MRQSFLRNLLCEWWNLTKNLPNSTNIRFSGGRAKTRKHRKYRKCRKCENENTENAKMYIKFWKWRENLRLRSQNCSKWPLLSQKLLKMTSTPLKITFSAKNGTFSAFSVFSLFQKNENTENTENGENGFSKYTKIVKMLTECPENDLYTPQTQTYMT